MRYRVIIPDRPGYGHSARPRCRWWDPRSQAARLRSMLVQLGVERPILFGHSFGARSSRLRSLNARYFERFPVWMTLRLYSALAHMVHCVDPRRVPQAIEAAAR
jgi:pimeloyl-ACP methyl ester carboxylesterase